MSDTPIPRDTFSTKLRQANDDPAALHSQSTIQTADFYGNAETWVVDTYRLGGGGQIVFIQRSSLSDPLRLVLPEDITKVIARQSDSVSEQARRRQGHRLIAQRRERGDTLGNPEALAKARKRRQR